jgi:leader peptidase (prepilin peptidase)/N-methyltransferase
MRVADVDRAVLHAAGAAVGALLGAAAARAADALPRRYEINVRASEGRQAEVRRSRVVVGVSIACALGVAHVLAGAPDLDVAHAGLLLVVNAALAAGVVASAAIDLEHMILPDELTLGGAAIALASSPLRFVGIREAIAGAALGLLLTYLPLLLYQRLRGIRGMGLGDAKMSAMAGAWHGVAGALLVVFAAATQLAIAAFVMRLAKIDVTLPESVQEDLKGLRGRAETGDARAKEALRGDPLARAARPGFLGMRLPLGPFLALACIEVLFLRRWLVDVLLR